ncbi:hypothetical protein C8R41DRAFT_936046 [Lentinula lateritia]|uniref:Integrase core domain-containing protein n=1 Tax=Lentinula lateritia TaxID=40482 RepID=A0ABQ8VE43_9AGAR|nr:hypothetical protein C8R41DRAFT_769164 [Lentinula lateritia]KAJ4498596.1 hypothetical protein C8R41DRAFT_936046 [Lentinula lateritia]
MEENYGVERGSYIWGRSVHNIRIERLWRDVTQGFGLKWYNFFFSLEVELGLLPDIDEHIWLLHYLFLPSINQDAHEWAGSWNSHNLQLQNERDRSPQDMFFFGAIQEGLRGPTGAPTHLEEHVEHVATYGVDWQDLGDATLLRHHNENNPHELEDLDHRRTRQPPHLSLVEVPAFNCPFESEEQLEIFNDALLAMPEYHSRDMTQRKSLWVQALDLLELLLPHSQ